MCVAVSHAGTGRSAEVEKARSSGSSTSRSAGRVASSPSSRRNTRKYASVDVTIASTARQPKWPSMKVVVQSHVRATINTGGAAKWVSVPPIDTFTKSRPERGVLQSRARL